MRIPLLSGVKVQGLAIAAVTALSGLGLTGLASAASAAPAPAKPYDFNGDGYTDVAIGSPYGTVGGVQYAGFVNIIYGSAAGLNTAHRQVFSQTSVNVPGAPEASDHFGYSLTSGDYDQDGFADLAIGVPDEDTTSGANAGIVEFLWGSQSGLVAVADQAAGSTEEPGVPTANHRFGESLSGGDIQRDGSPEMFYTVPGTSQFGWFFFGPAVTAKAGGTARTPHPGKELSRSAAEHVTTAKGAKTDVRTLSATDVSSSWLATGDVTGDHLEDVVYAWYDADAATVDDQHGFIVFPGTADGALNDATAVGVVGVDLNSVTAGDFDGDGFADVALGQTADANHIGGQVAVFKGAVGNISVAPSGSYLLNQDTPSVPGAGEAGDGFGASLAAGDINKDGRADLVVGAPTEDVNAIADAGTTFVLYGSAAGLTGTGSLGINQDTPASIPDVSEAGDKMGTQMALLDNTNDGFADMLAGAPAENAGDGMVTWLKGTSTGITTTGAQAITAATFGVTGLKAEIGRRLGRVG